ncbi:MAG: GMP synthase [Pseudomonadota bacterium]
MSGSPQSRLRRTQTGLRLGVLQADSVRAELQPDHGDYPAMFGAQLAPAAEALGLELTVTTYDVEHGELPAVPDACDGYLITGSRHSVYDPLPWIARLAEFVGAVRERALPLVGVCFGHQLLAHFFGGRVGRAAGGWAVGVHRSRVVARRSWMRPACDSLGLLSSHQDQVLELPIDAEVYVSNEFCPHAGFTVGDHTMTIQGHPEFCAAYARELMGVRREVLGEPLYRSGIDSLAQPTEADIMARWMLEFWSSRS